MRKSAVVAGIVAASIMSAGTALADDSTTPPPSTGPVAAIHPIRPAQYFNGLVNRSAGDGTIQLACPAPFHAGETGHPIAGQDVSVRQLFPPSAVSTLGFTGTASTIAASLTVVSATSAIATRPIPLAVFSLYDRPVAIPTTLTLPCGGSGAVVFDPVQGGNTARADAVRVKFVFIAAAANG
jgi:hypothetical protein